MYVEIIAPLQPLNIWPDFIYTIDTRYIALQYYTILRPTKQLRRWNFGQALGRAMGVFRELLGEKWPRDINSALYNVCEWIAHQRTHTVLTSSSLIFLGRQELLSVFPSASTSSQFVNLSCLVNLSITISRSACVISPVSLKSEEWLNRTRHYCSDLWVPNQLVKQRQFISRGS